MRAEEGQTWYDGWHPRIAGLAAIALITFGVLSASCSTGAQGRAAECPPLDLSGLARVGGDTLLAVHDAKAGEEPGCPRASLFILPDSSRGFVRKPLSIRWPEGSEIGHDLESAARVPGTPYYLLAESGDDGSSYRRIFLAELRPEELLIREAVDWPVPVVNVEGSAVVRIGDQWVFLFAERAHGKDSTQIAWAPVSFQPLTFGVFKRTAFHSPDPVGYQARPVSALEVDSAGRVYVASATDPGVDHGPYRSVVWEAGRMQADESGEPVALMLDEPVRLGTLDGLKVESLAMRGNGDAADLVVGTDDESYGGILRVLP